MTTVRCPNCRNDVVWSQDNAFRPFCSKRCRLIDLGEWFNESNRIPTDEVSTAPGNDEFNQD